MNKPVKIKQIAAIGDASLPVLYALGEDGRVYVRRGKMWDVERWEALPDLIPDDLETLSVTEDDDETHLPAWNQPLTVDSDA